MADVQSAAASDGVTAAQGRGGGATKAWLRALELTAPIAQAPHRTFADVMESAADRFGSAAALISEQQMMSFRGLAEQSNRYARWALACGLGRGDAVCVMLPNSPEYMAIWLGIIRVGAVAALVNTRLVGPSLAHSISIVRPKHIVVAPELLDVLSDALPLPWTPLPAHIWTFGPSQFGNLETALGDVSAQSLSAAERRDVSIDDLALYVYTSGTTGLPKAAKVSHFRLMMWTHWFAGMMATGPADRMYNCLPMYHSIGGAVATGAVLVNGGSVVIRERFSARRFWDDIADYDCTLFQYIGELCRYLVNAPAHPRESEHRLRLCCGNGLRADIWEAFQDRFRIPRILEFYAATEANISLFNVEGKPGAIGRVPRFLAHRSAIELVKFDVAANAPYRNSDGFCERCGVDEPGEAIGGIARARGAASDRASRFDGYTDSAATEKKVLRDVFEKGDAWFRTGDLMRRDAAGFYTFVDRIGDTFRWKGENVATSEVEAALAAFDGIVAANVFGVTIPGVDGRAGMAELVSTYTIDLSALRTHLARRLPGYAHPLIIRLRNEVSTTPTFKQVKNAGGPDAYDPALCPDPLYLLDPERDNYVALGQELYACIVAGEVRL